LNNALSALQGKQTVESARRPTQQSIKAVPSAIKEEIRRTPSLATEYPINVLGLEGTAADMGRDLSCGLRSELGSEAS
jgi:hypothetical protein